MWLNGPYECGNWPDINIFRNSLKSHLEDGERVEADDGYVGEAPDYIKCPASFANPQETLFMQQRVRNRQETINKRMKNWGILKQVYRHQFICHAEVFRAVAVVTQISIKRGEPLFSCGYRDPPYNENEEDISRRDELSSDRTTDNEAEDGEASDDDLSEDKDDSDDGISYNTA